MQLSAIGNTKKCEVAKSLRATHILLPIALIDQSLFSLILFKGVCLSAGA